MYNNLRRFLAFVFALIVLYTGCKAEKLAYWAVILIVAGEALRIWAAGYIRKNSALSIVGPYKYVRNPLYIGSLLIGIGFGFFVNNMIVLAAIVIAFLWIYTLKINSEEKKLTEIFGSKYLEYKQNTGRWLPFKKFRMKIAPLEPMAANFDIKLAILKNKEYNAVIGSIFMVFVIILVKTIC